MGARGLERTSGFRAMSAVLATSCAVLLPMAAQAQVAPSQSAAPTREELTRPTTPQPNDNAPRFTVEGGVGSGGCALDRPEMQNIRFTLSDVIFDDLRGLSPDALRPSYAGLIGQNLPLSAICQVRDAANAILAKSGYIAAIEVPGQRIGEGVVHLRVVMAKLVGLNFNGETGHKGNSGRNERLIRKYLARLTEQEVFNRFDAERYLLLAGDLPGYNVRLALRPAGTVRGEVIGEVIVQHYDALADLTVQNFGSRELGRWGGLARAQLFGLTGMGDRTQLMFFTTPEFKEQQTVQVAHEMRVGSEGLTIGGQLTYSWGHPDLPDPAIDIRSRTLFASLEASYPLVRRQETTLRGAVGFDLLDQDVTFNGIGLSRDRLRVPFVRLSYDRLDLAAGNPGYSIAAPRWRMNAVVEARHGIDGLGAVSCGAAFVNCTSAAVVPPSQFEGDASALVLRGTMVNEYRPDPRVTLALTTRAQYSAHPLMSFEEFSAGSYTTGRGYDPGALMGDSGVGVQAELRLGRAVPQARDAWAMEAFWFVDHAKVWNRDRLFITPDADLTSAGAGVRAAWGDNLRIEAMVAAPLDRLAFETKRGAPRFLLTLSTRLLPWSFK
jgi:hemolysin activation/secretion protein